MTKIIDKSADNQSEARISVPVAYNKDCHLSLMKSFVKQAPGQHDRAHTLNAAMKSSAVCVAEMSASPRMVVRGTMKSAGSLAVGRRALRPGTSRPGSKRSKDTVKPSSSIYKEKGDKLQREN